MRAMVAHVVSTVGASTVRSLVGESTVVSLSAVNIPVGNLVAVSTVGNLSAVNVRAESLVAANIAVGNLVAVNTANAVAMVSIATERERQRYAQPTSSPASVPESCLAGLGGFNRLQALGTRSPGQCRAPWRSQSRQKSLNRFGAKAA